MPADEKVGGSGGAPLVRALGLLSRTSEGIEADPSRYHHQFSSRGSHVPDGVRSTFLGGVPDILTLSVKQAHYNRFSVHWRMPRRCLGSPCRA